MTSWDGTPSRETLVIVGYTVPTVLLVASTVMRLFAKVSKEGLHLDDYLIILASALEVAYSVTILVSGVGHGFGHHTATVDPKDLEIFLKGEYIASHLYNLFLAATKLGILVLYYRIFPVPWFSKTVIGCSIFVLIWIAIIEALMGALCRPLHAFWDLTVKGKCFNTIALTYFVNSSNMVTDLVLFALPIPVILGVRTSRKKKIALIAIFSIGFITCGISAARLAYVVAQGSADITWEGVPLGILSAFESLGGILCANLPIIYRLFKTAAQKITSSVSGNKSYKTKTTNQQYGYDSTPYGSKSHGRQPRRSTDSERWIRMPNESDPGEMQTSAHCTSPDAKGDGFEMGPIPTGGIAVQREFHTQVEERV